MTAATTTLPGARIAGRTEPGEPHPVPRPDSGQVIAEAGWAGTDAVDRAVGAAREAAAGWAATPARDRAAALRAIAADLRAETEELGAIVCAETGKRLPEAQGEIGGSAKYFDWFAEAAAIAEIESGRTAPGRRFQVRHHPVGVVAALGTWNFPVSIPARKVAAAIAAGCPAILKASERTPVSADRLVAICERHLPPGVIGAVMGGPELANALIDHPDVAAVTFTGSTAIGRLVAERAARSFTRTVLELGGKAPFIIRPDADLADAVEHLMVAKLRNNGESCIAANNVFVHSSLREQLWDLLTERIGAVRPGAPEDPETDLGPMIDDAAAQRLRGLLAQAEADGAEVVRGQDGPAGDAYLPAALVACDRPTQLWDEEVFGPVLALRSYDDEDAVVAEVNGWGVGLAGYVCGTDLAAAEQLAERLRVGIVGINNGAPNTPEVPFGGFGGSGIGREGGMSGYLEFVEEQTIAVAR
ncbi:aldehyde dehydrogenase family protein [Ruania zhangjianzhongii]|uniref:aldehyde dehydrogenase family protein n=1 Tax=Ruania zhangjianzhongii TaxID=2603206 RepID=UPI0011C8846B|nr:aldehyde dehydrogenase family protein [Ruania zhangjianzhongii]